MAHFAEINSNGVVKQVIVVSNAELLVNGVESEQAGIAFCQSLFGGTWVQTSYSGKFRSVFAGVGYTYDKISDIFVSSEQPSNVEPQTMNLPTGNVSI
jgi:hypothetical protein